MSLEVIRHCFKPLPAMIIHSLDVHTYTSIYTSMHIYTFYYQQVSLSFNFRMGRSTVCSILKETCEAIWTALQPEYVKAPSCEAEWVRVSRQFEQIWNFPNCLGNTGVMIIDHLLQMLCIFTYTQVQSMASTSLSRHLPMQALHFIITRAHIR